MIEHLSESIIGRVPAHNKENISVQVKLRLQRFGSKKRPFYRIVAANSQDKRDGKFLDIVGIYHPLVKEGEQTRLDTEKINQWLARGATPSETVQSILSRAGIWKEHMAVKARNKAEKKKRSQKPAAV